MHKRITHHVGDDCPGGHMDTRTCKACQQDDHARCDSKDSIGNHDYCGPRPICACLGSDEHPV